MKRLLSSKVRWLNQFLGNSSCLAVGLPHGTIGQLNAMYDIEANTMRMDWLDKLTPEERRRFKHQLCIGYGEAGHIRRDCPHTKAADNTNVQKTFTPRQNNGPPPKPSFGPSKTNYPSHNNNRNNINSGNHPKHNMGG